MLGGSRLGSKSARAGLPLQLEVVVQATVEVPRHMNRPKGLDPGILAGVLKAKLPPTFTFSPKRHLVVYNMVCYTLARNIQKDKCTAEQEPGRLGSAREI